MRLLVSRHLGARDISGLTHPASRHDDTTEVLTLQSRWLGGFAVLRTRQWVDRRPILDLDRVSAGGRLARQTVRKAPSHYSFHYPITTTTGRYLTGTVDSALVQL